ncbi:hypothetical protein PAXRUDRAFT_35179 [Paxillus rubicundulus Ve08.2h10]|uniref:BTB domain-containing protein n=1 Tax=Paxillus rubicundulus Ve08.2h10 TaxID=930991 RepID=A0A0D0DS37_9AGAM|nr:hypothetical protein PAXRUDRAFT_35179 [Paxillus rubicundulus Ve08.2h10]
MSKLRGQAGEEAQAGQKFKFPRLLTPTNSRTTTLYTVDHNVYSETTSPVRHAYLSFTDGNIVILADSNYFLVHQGLLARHSQVLGHLITEGWLVLPLPEPSDTIACFLQVLCDGTSLTCDEPGFATVASLLRVLITYKVWRIRHDILQPPGPVGVARIEVIKLARDINTPFLLPYDLLRCTPSDAATGIYKLKVGAYIRLDECDLMYILRGREHASRYFSTFIVNELEGRIPSALCLRRNETSLLEKRACQMAFEAITFKLLRDVNGISNHRTSDPLYAITDAELVLTREGVSEENSSPFLQQKKTFGGLLPGWFSVDVPKWG